MLKNRFLLNKNAQQPEKKEEQLALDDARRIKVLSPSMMVFKRFIRNKLAIIGFVIIVIMFIFSFLGPLFSPYAIDQKFMDNDAFEYRRYATARYNVDPRYYVEEGSEFGTGARSAMLLELGKAKNLQVGSTIDFSDSSGNDYMLTVMDISLDGKISSAISSTIEIAKASMGEVTWYDESLVDEAMLGVILARAGSKSGPKEIEYNDTIIEVSGKQVDLTFTISGEPFAMTTYDVYRALDSDYEALCNSFNFAYEMEVARMSNIPSVEYDGVTFIVDEDGDDTVVRVNNQDVILISDIVIGTESSGTVLTNDFILTAISTIRDKGEYFTFVNNKGETVETQINLVNSNYYLDTKQPVQLFLANAAPNSEHWLGTENNGMDVLTRLMYGGRISLMVGFVVIFFEIIIGVVIGGISGYFGGVIDTILMRLVDLFNAIPFYPMIIILGNVMDNLKVPGIQRIFILMAIMGILGWTGTARVVRGQILSLREQDFMVATEATGIKTSRRIFRHLVPNVMPLLIVQASMGLGGVIISEATLGFLGLGVKYPMASWGSIINQATDMQIMRTAWWVWIPAGALILLTVLGFNFVGDGLRDAFDPKMKR
ncbi:MAG TPA: ABC transporter permease [Eubacteriales bacterium]|nr:ABC transporter permease [Clostridia bacterium]HRV73643.1 ABC transporter permease [Eubacteriales bacterium]